MLKAIDFAIHLKLANIKKRKFCIIFLGLFIKKIAFFRFAYSKKYKNSHKYSKILEKGVMAAK